mmetsp:Transcript_9918/g.17867  ORF Transcript_9918/g.17867 Transcript_9918/m.17867 type:complete len:615 (-) Transcript_9918:1080-2924(-)|eukprot:CAMPEP_0182448024 /NCGR_PEP_ID=MMETSP1172-20130603/22805_1 /TAXON_ID=708627 /ORGANISM="Timspurckia oligopyrenoides, Strain CCMP3278" /LENGTH=614 /DNA_ID=CAMNT_0024644721 /DNA_START=44 /DNA_END=1888 /DNA_ORIENTATION=+
MASVLPVIEDVNLRRTAKISDKIAQREKEGKPFFSFEYFPPKTESGVVNLYERVERMAAAEPLFCDMTWGAGGSTSDLTLDLVGNIQKYLGLDVMMHLTCTNMSQGMVKFGLEGAKERGCRNILALRGDPPAGKEWTKCEDGFEHGTDLVRYIRQEFGDYFSIGVAGYPEGHPAGSLSGTMTYEEEMKHLKEKVDAGADFIITQMFYDVDNFLKFVKDCRDIGILIPVLPGILPIQNYGGFRRMTEFCKTMIPPAVDERMEALKDDDAGVKQYGIELGIQMCKKILDSGLCPGIHFYTLNLEKSVMAIVEGLGLLSYAESVRSYPWRPATLEKRHGETVRPIFWANRSKSYVERTSAWSEFPSDRWGTQQSPAFGDISEHHLAGSKGVYAEMKRMNLEMWGEPKSISEVQDVFEAFLSGQVKRLPWSESESMSAETASITSTLKWLNRNGILTINSQPRVNGAPSSDVTVGWGAKNGYVYQKAYIEFFAPKKIVDALFESALNFPLLSVYAVTAENGSELRTNVLKPKTNAVTWGVFPDSELVQPTVVDPATFMIWKEEAFSIWTTNWASLYEPGSPAIEVLKGIQSNYYLVNIVDNDYVAGDIFRIFKSILKS